MRRTLCLAVALLAAVPAQAQRAEDNAVKSADDAFGNSVGNENIGLYNPFEVRGFSAVDAGNVRLDGLYFDRQTDPTSRLAPGSTMRVGISAQGYPLPAPTGIVDYALTRAGDATVIGTLAGYGPFDGWYAEADAKLPIVPGRLSLALGAGYASYGTEYDTRDLGWSVGLVPRWRPNDALEVVAFYGRLDVRDDEALPLLFPAGANLPPRFARGVDFTQDWADGEFVGTNYGTIVNAALAPGWELRAGLFRSIADNVRSYADLYLDVTPDGLAQHAVVADRDSRFASTSGEARLSRTLDEGPRRHTLHLVARGRDNQRRYGGSDLEPLGLARVGVPDFRPRPNFTFGPKTRDEVRQWTGALAYHGRWAKRGELSAGVQRTQYEKTVLAPGAAPVEGRDEPWLWNLAAAVHASEELVFYASRSTGLEEGGVAPQNAANRDVAAPAIRTRQWDAGLRYQLAPNLNLVAGVFDVAKPYYALDAARVFRELGEQRHRGIEVSVAGRAAPGLNLVAGTVLLRPRASGEEVAGGQIGEVPAGQTRRLTIVGAEWQLPWLAGFSVDTSILSVADRMASRDNALEVPGRTQFDLGARYRFKVGRAPATLRAQVGNVLDKFGWRTNASGVIVPVQQRRYGVSLALDL